MDESAAVAALTLKIAGCAAAPATPALRHLAAVTNSVSVSARAIWALTTVDDDPAPTLAHILLNPGHRARAYAIDYAIESHVAPRLIPLLRPAVTNADEQVAAAAVEALGSIACRHVETPSIETILQQASNDRRALVSHAAKDMLKIYPIEYENY